MKPPFSMEELNRRIQQDDGLKRFIETMPPEEADRLRDVFLNPSALQNLFETLPESCRPEKMFPGITTHPEAARRLYEEGRYFEAREAIFNTLEIYESPRHGADWVLNKATGFIARRLRASCHHLLGEIEWALGNAHKSKQHHETALQLAREIKDPETIAKSLMGLAAHDCRMGEFDAALSHCNKALKVLECLEDLWEIKSKLLTTKSVICDQVGETRVAVDHAVQAVNLCADREPARPLLVCLNNLACIYASRDDTDMAIEVLEDALEVAQKENDGRMGVRLKNNLAMVHLKRSSSQTDVEPAARYLEIAESLSVEMGDKGLYAMTRNSQGFLYRLTGRDQDAADAAFEAAAIYAELGAGADEAAVLSNLAVHLKDRLNEPLKAFEVCKKAILNIERIRGGLKRETHRITYADKTVDPYETMVEILLGRGKPGQALEYVERAKSRALLDFMGARIVDRMAVGIGSETLQEALKILGEIDEIRHNLEAITGDENTRAGTYDSPQNRTKRAAHTRDLRDQLTRKERSFDRVYSDVTALDPESASFLGVLPASFQDMSALLDDETVFLAFFQTDRDLHLFLVAEDGLLKTVSTGMSAQDAYDTVQNVLSNMRQYTAPDVRSHDFIRHLRRPLVRCFQKIMGPLIPLIAPYRRLILSPHLFWHYFPFHAMFDPEQKFYLCDRFEMGYCSSASVLGLCLQKQHTGRERALILSRNSGDLPYVEKEADLIAGAFDGTGRVYKGNRAHLNRIETESAPYDVIHMACHGRFDGQHPFLSGIDMPPTGDKTRPAYLLDFLDIPLNCNLATLSVCDSGLNRITQADELVGLSRGLFYAGAAGVMVSLWRVSDESTCYFMENFYWHYVKNRQTKTRALQLAMQAVKAREQWRHPFFWAPFVVMGDWR